MPGGDCKLVAESFPTGPMSSGFHFHESLIVAGEHYCL